MNVDEMQAERELDALIAEKVMGYTLDYELAENYDGPTVKELRDKYDENGILPYYSSDIADAWQVVLQFVPSEHFSLYTVGPIWYCFFRLDPEQDKSYHNRFESREYTAPLAICRAALKAVDNA